MQHFITQGHIFVDIVIILYVSQSVSGIWQIYNRKIFSVAARHPLLNEYLLRLGLTEESPPKSQVTLIPSTLSNIATQKPSRHHVLFCSPKWHKIKVLYPFSDLRKTSLKKQREIVLKIQMRLQMRLFKSAPCYISYLLAQDATLRQSLFPTCPVYTIRQCILSQSKKLNISI
jgi:hypothetical protein